MAYSIPVRRITWWSVRVDPVVLVAVGVGLIVGFLALYPTVMLFVGSLSDAPLGLPGHFTLAHYRTA